MIKNALYLFLLVLTLGCEGKTDRYDINFLGFDDYNNTSTYLYFFNPESPKEHIVVKGDEVVNGKFQFNGIIKEPQKVNLLFKKGEDCICSMNFLIEPGNIQVKQISKGGPVKDIEVIGGIYNTTILDLWRNSDVLKKFREMESSFYKANMTDEGMRLARVKSEELNLKIRDSRKNIFKNFIKASKDPYMKSLALEYGNLIYSDREYAIKVLAEIEQEHGANIVTKKMRITDKARQLAIHTKEKFSVGKYIDDFSAPTADMQEMRLKDVLAENKIVLVEFWASWCAPCRREIPNLKRAYEEYHKKGFEIFAFSIDDDKDKWVKTSEKENLPWINTSDLKATESPVVKMYGIRSVPQNYLVGKDGKILAMDLHGEELGENLKELLK